MNVMISKETEEHMEVLCKSLTDITLNRRLDSKTILYGVQAFLMALKRFRRASNHGTQSR